MPAMRRKRHLIMKFWMQLFITQLREANKMNSRSKRLSVTYTESLAFYSLTYQIDSSFYHLVSNGNDFSIRLEPALGYNHIRKFICNIHRRHLKGTRSYL